MCMNLSVLCLSTFMSMHDRCQHTRARTCRDHSHTLELRWWRVWRWIALAPHTTMHASIHTCVYVYHIFFLLIVHDSWLSNSLFLLGTGDLICTITSCRPCHPAFLPTFQILSECVSLSRLFPEYCALQASEHTDIHLQTDRHTQWMD